MENSDRSHEIFEILKKRRQISNAELAQLLHCSTSTLRRELLKMEKELLIKRAYGRVILTTPNNIEFGHTYRENENRKNKQKIAQLAQDFIGPNMCLFLDSSSTVQFLSSLINRIPNLVIVTNGLKTAYELSETENSSLKLYIIGGEIKQNTNSVFTLSDYSFFDHFKFDLSFFSCRGISIDGIYEADLNQAQLKKKMMSQSKKSILLADSSKFDSSHFFKISNWNDYHSVLSNGPISSEYQLIFEENEVDFLYYLE